MHLIIVERLKTTIKVVKVLILDKKVGFCDNTLQNTLRDVELMKRFQSLICHRRMYKKGFVMQQFTKIRL